MLVTVDEVPNTRTGKLQVTTHDVAGKEIGYATGNFATAADYGKAARATGTTVALLRTLVAELRQSGRCSPYNTNLVPDIEFRVRGIASGGGTVAVYNRFDSALEAAGPTGVVEWDDTAYYCVLDLDFADGQSPHCNDLIASAATLLPTPQQYWISRSCGLHAVYLALDPFTAVELASVAAYQLQRRYPEATIEFLSRTRGVPVDAQAVQCTANASMHGANPLLMRHDSVDAAQYLADCNFEIGQRYSHDLCPVNPHPRAQSNSPPVCVRAEGVQCYICEADGVYRGSTNPGYFPYHALLGTRHETVLASCVNSYTHWGHAQYVMQSTIRDPFHGRTLYSALLKARHGEDTRLPSVFTAGEPYGIVRHDGFWADYTGTPLVIEADSALIHSLPHASDSVAAAWLVQSVDLTPGGYPAIHPVRGIALSQNQPSVSRRILSVIASDLQPATRPSYAPVVRRADVESSWQLIEKVFPGVNRSLVTLLIVGAGCVEQRAGLPPMLFLRGPTGVGKTSHVELAAAMIGDAVSLVRYNRDMDRYYNGIMRAKQAGRFVLFDEFFKTAGQANTDAMTAMETLLSFNESSSMYMIHVGSIPMGALPFFIWTDTTIPQEVLTHAQIGRRVHTCRLHHSLAWNLTLPEYGLHRIGALRELGRDYVVACDAIVSDCMDRYFTGPATEFACVAETLGFERLQDNDAMTDRTDMIRALYSAWQNAPPITEPNALKRWSKAGYKLCDGALRVAFEALQTQEELGGAKCYMLDQTVLQTALRLDAAYKCERSREHGRHFAIRFVRETDD